MTFIYIYPIEGSPSIAFI